tara:strand:+ start:502 stop:1041 length:540 start_codon:yes stop_codon:yes gene_type:complete
MSSILKVSEIQDPTNGNTALEVDTSGNVTYDGHFISLTKNGNQSISDSTLTQVTTWTVEGSSGLSWDSTDNEIDVAVAGAYFVNFQCQVYSNSNNLRQLYLHIFKNGSKYSGSYNLIGQTASDLDFRHYTANVSNIIPLAANDTLEFHVYVTGSSPFVFDGDSSGGEKATNVSMFRVGN